MGDFNEILFLFEKKGGRIREERQMVAFRDALEDCELNDLGVALVSGLLGKKID